MQKGGEAESSAARILERHWESHLGRWCTLIVASIVALVWVPPLWSSLWLDETVTVWIGSASWPDALERAREFQFSSRYFSVVWLSLRLPIDSMELRARLPSIVCVVASLPFVFLFASRLESRAAGWLSVVILATSGHAAFIATDARFYGVCLLSISVAMWLHLRWLKEGRLVDGLLSMVAASITVYVHPFAGLILLVVGLSTLRRAALRPGAVAVILGCGLLLVLPYTPIALEILERRDSLAWASWRSLPFLFRILLYPEVTLLLCLGWAFTSTRAPGSYALRDLVRMPSILWLWILVPPLVLLAAAAVTRVPPAPRYIIAAFPAVAIALGIVLSRLPELPRTLVLVAAVLLALTGAGEIDPLDRDWRTLGPRLQSAGAGSDAVVFLRSGLVEANDLAIVSDELGAGYLRAPILVYPFPVPVISVPYDWSHPGASARVLAELGVVVDEGRRFFLAGNLPEAIVEGLGRAARGYTMDRIDADIVEFVPPPKPPSGARPAGPARREESP